MGWQARVEDLIVTQAGDELLIYDERTTQLHQLNGSAAAIWHHCDGKTTIPMMATHLDMDTRAVQQALGTMQEHGLVTGDRSELGDHETPSRRDMLRRAGAVALPVIASITAPAAVSATSCTPNGQYCNLNDPGACCSLSCTSTDGSFDGVCSTL